MIGTLLGHYRVLERIGEGGMGVVYKALDTHLDRFVAIKLLSPGSVADAERKARFVQEAKAASALNHPNIVHIYDISSDGGTDFIAMEFVAGRTLDHLIPEGMPAGQSLKVASQIADAMATAHDAGIVHRDLKPSNVMVDEHGFVKVVDFGLAKLSEVGVTLGDAATRSLGIATAEGKVVGTLGYMSPEQVEGKPLDGRSDIFSLGAILYEMLTGRRAFRGDTAAATLAAVIKDDPPPVTDFAREVPPGIVALVSRCLRKWPDERYQTMADVRAAIGEVEEESAPGRSRSRAARATQSVRRRWRWVAVALLPVVVAAGGWSAWRYVRAARLKAVLGAPDIVVLADFDNSTGDPAFDVTLREALSSEIQNSNVLRALSPALTGVVLADMKRPPGTPLTPAIAREVCARAGEKATIEGAIAALGSRYVLTLKAVNCRTEETLASQVEEAPGKEQVLSALAKAARGVREKLGESLPRLERLSALPGTTTSFEAFRAYATAMATGARGQWAAAIPHFARAIAIDPDFALAYQGEAIASSMLGDNNRSHELFRLGFEHRANANERERLWIEGRYYEEEGEFDKARASFEQLVQLYPNHQLGMNSLANIHREFGDWEAALPPSREFIRLAPEASIGYALLMMTLAHLDRFDEARAVADMPVPRRLNPPDVRLGLLRLAYLQGDTASAETCIKALEPTALAIRSVGIQKARAFSAGQFRSADELQARADEIARRRNATAAAAMVRSDGIPWRANAGLCADVRAMATPGLLAADVGRAPAAIAAVATCGAVGDAQGLLGGLQKTDMRGQLWSDGQLPLINARLLLAQRKASDAIAVLEPARVFERAIPGILLARGEAQLMAGNPAEAAAEFRKILGVRENVLRNDYNAAQVGLARALAAAADVAGAKTTYESFFDRWKSADADVPLLVAAKTEYAALQGRR